MGFIWTVCSAIASRLIFIGHAVYSLKAMIERIELQRENSKLYWILALLFVSFIAEGVYTIYKRKGQEFNFFWPSGFIYLTLMIPITWILELFLLNEEIKCLTTKQTDTTYNTTSNQALVQYCRVASSASSTDQKLRAAIEIGMLGALVFGRWLLPRGDLTRDQLSALLLSFIGNGADVIEFLNTSSDFPELRTRTVTYTVLAIYSLSLLQFTVVTTKTTYEYDETDESNGRSSKSTEDQIDPNLPMYIQRMLRKQMKKTVKSPSKATSSMSSSSSTNQHKNSFHNRARTFTTDSVFTADNNNKARTMTINSVLTEKNNNDFPEPHKQKNVRFSQTEDYKSTGMYFQKLAEDEKWDKFSDALSKGRLRGFSVRSNFHSEAIDEDEEKEKNEETTCLKKIVERFDQEIFQILITLFTLEAPYFIARVSFALSFNISSITMIFYTMKNIIMILFLGYRLWVILSGNGEEEEEIEKREN